MNDTAVELRKADAEASDRAIARLAIEVTKADPGIWESAVEGQLARGWDPEVVLAAAVVPVLLLQANPDMGAVLADTDATRAADLLPQGRYVKWDDVGHGMHDAQPERFVQLVNAFFGKVLRNQG